jgi:hypothetical protein
MKIAGVFDGMEPEVIREVSLKSGGHMSGRIWGKILNLEDPRCSGKVEHRLIDILVTKVKKRMEQVDASIARYLAALDRADREEGNIGEAKAHRLKDRGSAKPDRRR